MSHSVGRYFRRNRRRLWVRWTRPWARYQAGHSGPGCHHVAVAVRMIETHDENARGVVDALRALGRPAALHIVRKFDEVGPLRSGDRVIAFGIHRFGAFEPRPDVVYAGVQTEQYPDDWSPTGETNDPMVRKADAFLACCDVTFESNEALALEGARRGRISDGVLPFGYSPRIDSGRLPQSQPRHEIAFIGRLAGQRRQEIFRSLAGEFRMAPETRAWGRQRAGFLRSASIQLNFHQSDKLALAGHRFALALANGCFVLSEPLPEGSPFVAGEHYAVAAIEKFPDAIRRWLADESGRREIARRGREFIRGEYRLEDAARRLLPILDAHARTKAARRG